MRMKCIRKCRGVSCLFDSYSHQNEARNGSTEASDVELKHILLAHVNDHFLYGDGDISRYSSDKNQNPSHLKTKSKKTSKINEIGIFARLQSDY